jgi:hypothetical protein
VQVTTDKAVLAQSAAKRQPAEIRISRLPPREAPLARRFAWKVYSIGWGISVAGAAYPLVVALICCVCELIGSLASGQSSYPPGAPLTAISAACTYGAVIGFIWAMLVCICVLPFVYFFVRSLALRGSVVRLSALSGGLVGFLATMPLFLLILFEGLQTWWQLASIVALGPALTTVLGQVGGAWGGWRVGSYEQAVSKEWANGLWGTAPAEANHSVGSSSSSPPRVQFRVWHMLVVSIWVSLPLTAIRLSGFGFGFALVLLIGWGVFQTVTLYAGGLAAAQIGRWRARRQTRST